MSASPRRATIIQDGRLLTGDRWITPSDYADAEVASHELPSLKGASPTELPSLAGQGDQAGLDA